MKLIAHAIHLPPFPTLSIMVPATPRHLHGASLKVALLILIAFMWKTAPAHSQAAPTPQPQAQSAPAVTLNIHPTKHGDSGEINEEQLKQQLVGKPLFLRGGFQGDSLRFNEHGELTGHVVPGSFTLSAVEIEKINLTKHKLELEGARFALHFLGETPYDDPSKTVDRVKITPKKKTLRITIDREQVIKSKKSKEAEKDKKQAIPAAPTQPESADEQAADPVSVTTTLSPAHSARLLQDALNHVFAPGLDDKLRAQMPEFWQLYYQSQAAGVAYRPRDPAILRSNAVDQQAKLTSSIAPDSNEFAQANGIAGRALYRVVVGTDGKPGEIAVIRPIGFGLDENAVTAIRKASFQPAVKAGQPVPEALDLAVSFRIFSKRTSVAGAAENDQPAAKPALPGPYSVKKP